MFCSVFLSRNGGRAEAEVVVVDYGWQRCSVVDGRCADGMDGRRLSLVTGETTRERCSRWRARKTLRVVEEEER